jgi:hypothetical protein
VDALHKGTVAKEAEIARLMELAEKEDRAWAEVRSAPDEEAQDRVWSRLYDLWDKRDATIRRSTWLNTLKVRFSAMMGEEPEVEVALV